ncbi:MAG TPA: ubiquinol-cytochrome c reductase iron-sulfur subunit [Steroidobacteraceae bacterium]|nr:ubiquinol-cytochrome c reductase iron-sulfur subunit [Steroidobacteraceae bacterium]
MAALQCLAGAGCSVAGQERPARVQVDLRQIAAGSSRTFLCGDANIVVRHRTPDEIAIVAALETGGLLYPQPDAARTRNAEWIVLEARCTHLGCGLIEGAGRYRGWLCPCHGSEYDPSGRVTRGPAAENLRIPAYRLLGRDLLAIDGCRNEE